MTSGLGREAILKSRCPSPRLIMTGFGSFVRPWHMSPSMRPEPRLRGK